VLVLLTSKRHFFRRFDEQVTGGNSLIVDMFHAIDILRRESPEAFQVLARVPVAFGTIDYQRKQPAHLVHRKTIIVVDYDDQVQPGTVLRSFLDQYHP